MTTLSQRPAGLAASSAASRRDEHEPAAPPGSSLLTLRPENPGSAFFDLDAAKTAAAALLAAFGVPSDSEAALRTPARMVAGLAELLSTSAWEFTTFPNTERQHELVLARNIPFTSVCAHHLLPFSGLAHVGVLPGERIAGLSKLARAVDEFAARLQVQEELGQQIVSFLEERLACRGVGVVLEAEHLCMTRRGVKAQGCDTVTIATRGLLRDDPAARSEFLSMAHVSARRAA
ncbi:GTP cyclohydrolase I [Frankia sp. AgB1.9]|uniref:GTP cyclohydrolase I n=1 Tax=unclassified Frankia TaxID=2632575 RepID=UPI0019344C62|nr:MULTISPECIES: GTP cyclohydrolase I FolE [unclassified Frankia]MBL7489742.1 GTP cyclohydrolase I [Frankia sp. AgW1.1]MBL7551952.1 GTP cyclohydrolase I [Frankia sp. AgB1.9]MBL7623209.1 GTP cyclohydrolase I [Frankia sp. AgB1.8]